MKFFEPKRWMFASAATAALLLAGCGGSPRPATAQPEVIRARVTTIRMETVPDELEAPGTVQSVSTAPVAARVMATVVSVPVREGDFVKRGQLLVQLDERELMARQGAARAAIEEARAAREETARGLAAAEAQAGVAAKTYERFQFLQKEKSVSPQEFDEVEAKYRAAQAGFAAARARQKQVDAMGARAESEARAAETVAGYARITAPFDGVVVRRDIEPGRMASPGAPLLTLEETSRYRVEVTLPAGALVPRRGAKARVRLDALPETELEGTVVEVEAGADSATQTIRTRVELPAAAAGLRSGLFGRAWFRQGERRALLVSLAAVLERGQLKAVYVLDAEQVARLRLVTLGAALGDRVEVLSGLAENDRVALPEKGTEIEGRKVEARP